MRGVSKQAMIEAAVAEFYRRPHPLSLRCGVQHYSWGDFESIPTLLGIDNRECKPYAELWIGAHPDLPSEAKVGNVSIPLDKFIASAPEQMLGQETAEQFDRQLPFLLKILSARQPLSIQVHPNKQQGREGYAQENRLGIELTDPTRNFRDDNHKPELLCALTPFYALRGFRPLEEIAKILCHFDELEPLCRVFNPTQASLRALYTRIMRGGADDINAVLTPLVKRLQAENSDRPFGRQNWEYWFLRADRIFSSGRQKDRGLFSIFLLNLLRLEPGQAIFLPAGELHAYLQGTGVEIMANSNNVLRGGLTPKHVNVDKLLEIVNFTGGKAEVLTPDHALSAPGRLVYTAPAREFQLSRLHVTNRSPLAIDAGHPVQLCVITEGNVTVSTEDDNIFQFSAGQVFLIPQELAYTLSTPGEAVVFQATVPTSK
jgi:mannose-6-phosphate isomerase